MVAEFFPASEESDDDKLESKREKDFNRADRMKENLMKLEKSMIDEVDEATMQARAAIQAMGFGITPVAQTDDDAAVPEDDEDDE